VHQQKGLGEAPPEGEAVTAQLERILANGDFDASPRSRAFLRFIVEETLAGRQEGLTQAAIATRVFGRRADFDPTVDPIVRIQAGRLRRSIERYYLLAGAGEPVRIELQRGTYAPVLRWAGPPEAPEADAGTSLHRRLEDAGGWPSVELSLQSGVDPDLGFDPRAAQFLDHLAVELDRYRDVRVVIRQDLDRLPSPGGRGGTFALSGRLFEEGGSRRLAVRLVDCRTARQLWAEEYRETPDLASDVLREMAQVVAGHVASEFGIVAQTLWGELRTSAAEETTYGALLRSYRFFAAREPADLVSAVEALRRALASEPQCALAWAWLSRLHVANHAFEVAPAETSIDQGLALAQHAVLLDPSSQRGRAVLAFALLVKGELAAGLAEAGKALELNADTFVYLETIGWLLALLGDWDRGTALIRRAVARNPHHLSIAFHALWADHLRRGEIEASYQAAVQYRDAAWFWRSVMRASCLGHLGRLEEAQVEVAELLRHKPDFASRGRTLIGRLIKFPDLLDRVAVGLGKAGLELA